MSCTNPSKKELHSYRQSPAFIKKFINSLYHQRFFIAERGGPWESSCVLREGEKSCQFISASIDSTQYKLDFWGGGYGGKHKETIIINFQKGKVTSYGFGNRPNEFTKVDADE